MEEEELRQVATFYAIYKIFHTLTDDPEGYIMSKAHDYLQKAQNAIDSFRYVIDTDDDGKVDQEEKNTNFSTGKIIR